MIHIFYFCFFYLNFCFQFSRKPLINEYVKYKTLPTYPQHVSFYFYFSHFKIMAYRIFSTLGVQFVQKICARNIDFTIIIMNWTLIFNLRFYYMELFPRPDTFLALFNDTLISLIIG